MIGGVITGDIVHSTQFSNEELNELLAVLESEVRRWSDLYKMKLEIFQGDSFVCLVLKPATTLRVALLFKTYIRSLNPDKIYHVSENNLSGLLKRIRVTNWMFDARIATGLGEVQVNKKLATSGGEAFILSGRMLDKLKDSKQHFAIKTTDQHEEEWGTAAVLLDAIISKTTSLQCEVINYKLLGFTETEIAKTLNIKQAAVNQRSSAGNWHAINTLVTRFEKVYADA